MLKATLKKMPLVRDAVRWLMSKTVAKRQKGFVSRDYWEGRYAKGLDSGAGSYNRLATYKADFLNKFVAENAIERVIEFGSGDGAQLELADYPEYIGIDVSKTAIARTRTKFRSDLKKTFFTPEEYDGKQADLALSLDVIYHLIEDDVFENYMRSLFNSSTRFVIIYSSNELMKSDSPHVRHRRFSDWVERHTKANLVSHERNPYPYSPANPDNTSFADFFVYQLD